MSTLLYHFQSGRLESLRIRNMVAPYNTTHVVRVEENRRKSRVKLGQLDLGDLVARSQKREIYASASEISRCYFVDVMLKLLLDDST